MLKLFIVAVAMLMSYTLPGQASDVNDFSHDSDIEVCQLSGMIPDAGAVEQERIRRSLNCEPILKDLVSKKLKTIDLDLLCAAWLNRLKNSTDAETRFKWYMPRDQLLELIDAEVSKRNADCSSPANG